MFWSHILVDFHVCFGSLSFLAVWQRIEGFSSQYLGICNYSFPHLSWQVHLAQLKRSSPKAQCYSHHPSLLVWCSITLCIGFMPNIAFRIKAKKSHQTRIFWHNLDQHILSQENAGDGRRTRSDQHPPEIPVAPSLPPNFGGLSWSLHRLCGAKLPPLIDDGFDSVPWYVQCHASVSWLVTFNSQASQFPW